MDMVDLARPQHGSCVALRRPVSSALGLGLALGHGETFAPDQSLSMPVGQEGEGGSGPQKTHQNRIAMGGVRRGLAGQQ